MSADLTVRPIAFGGGLSPWVILFREAGDDFPADAPLAFTCAADDVEHAEEQCLNAYPGCHIVWAAQGCDVAAAFAEYWEDF